MSINALATCRIFSTTKKKLRPNSLFALTEEDQREDLEIFVVNNQERERDISEGAEVGVMKRWESREMLMWLLWGH